MTMALEGGEGSASHPGRSLSRERPGTHCTGGWVGPRCGKSRPPPRIRFRTVQPVASRYTDATWPTNFTPTSHIFASGLGNIRQKYWTQTWPTGDCENRCSETHTLFTKWRKGNSIFTSNIYRTVWVKFSCKLSIHKTCEFHEKLRRKTPTFLIGIRGNTFTHVPRKSMTSLKAKTVWVMSLPVWYVRENTICNLVCRLNNISESNN